MTNLIGKSIDRYHILEQLGEGGMATVYKAYDTRLERDVAIKVIRTERLTLETMPKALKRFEREAQVLAKLSHPNIVPITDYGEFDKKPYLVMPYLSGGTLKRHLKGKPISLKSAARVLIPIANALQYAHQQGIIHRDIKPSNILITQAGQPMLSDFGIAKIIEDDTAAELTGTSAAIGTPEYMAPEQITAKSVDYRADIYSLGIVLYEMLTGRTPFHADTPMAVMIMHARDPLPRPRSIIPAIPQEVENFLFKALAKKPENRYQNMDEFARALIRAVNSGSAQTISESQKPQSTLTPSEVTLDTQSATYQKRGETPAPNSQLSRSLSKTRKNTPSTYIAIGGIAVITLLCLVFGVSYLVNGVLASEAPTFVLPTNTKELSALPTSIAIDYTFTPTVINPTSTIFVPPTPVVFSTPITPSITPVPTRSEFTTLIGGGSGQIAYTSNRINKLPQIFIADLISSTNSQVTNMPEGACQPSWAPDGMKLVFISPCKGMDEIYTEASLYIVNFDGTEVTSIPSAFRGDFDPKWSPDGKFIAFTSLRTGQMEIFLLNVADQSVTQLTKGATDVESRQAAWSSNGSMIAYVVKRWGVYQIWLMNTDGTEQRQIIRSGTDYTNYLPTWSPDGQLIIFNQRCATKFCLPYLMSAALAGGSEQGTNLGLTVLPVEDVEYSPDGNWIVYEGDESENKDIFYMTVKGANRTRITSDSGLDFDPTWRP